VNAALRRNNKLSEILQIYKLLYEIAKKTQQQQQQKNNNKNKKTTTTKTRSPLGTVLLASMSE